MSEPKSGGRTNARERNDTKTTVMFLVLVSVAFLTFGFLWIIGTSANDEELEGLSQRLTEAASVSKPYGSPIAEHSVGSVVPQFAVGEEGFREWGKVFILEKVNHFLTVAPVYGLTGPLTPEMVTNHSKLKPTGAYLWLHTMNASHRFRYEHGVLWEVIALNDDLLATGRKPEVRETWRDATTRWNTAEAKERFYATARGVGLDADVLAQYKLLVDAEPFLVGDESVYPYCDVKLVDGRGETKLHGRFRRIDDDGMALTYWGNFLRGISDDVVSTDGEGLRSRFFP